MTQLDNATRAPHRVQIASCAPTRPTTAFSPDFLIPHLLSKSDFLILTLVHYFLLFYPYPSRTFICLHIMFPTLFASLHLLFHNFIPHLLSHPHFLACFPLHTPCNKVCVFSLRVYLCFKYPTKCSITQSTLWPDQPIVLSYYRIYHFLTTG